MVEMFFLPRFTPKQLLWALILISFTVIMNVVYLDHVITLTNKISSFTDNVHSLISNAEVNLNHISNNKYVLFWNGYKNVEDQDVQCPEPNENCIFKDKSNIGDLLPYAIIFSEDILNLTDKPNRQREEQLYVFWSRIPSENAPACLSSNDNFFNWTFTYRLDSTIVWANFVVQHLYSREIVAPNKAVIWEMNNDALDYCIGQHLLHKSKPLAWILSNSVSNKTNSETQRYMTNLRDHMAKLDLFIDEFNNTYNKLDDIIHRDYYFVIAFEDFDAEDYVSDKVLRAYNNSAVPVVYGGANYSWFLPPGSYLNAKEMQPYSLANTIKAAVSSTDKHQSFFNWTNVYRVASYKDFKDDSHPLCKLCSTLNEEQEQSWPAIPEFRQWWNSPVAKETCLTRKLPLSPKFTKYTSAIN